MAGRFRSGLQPRSPNPQLVHQRGIHTNPHQLRQPSWDSHRLHHFQQRLQHRLTIGNSQHSKKAASGPTNRDAHRESDADSYAYSHADADGDGDADSYADSYAYSDADGNARADGYSNTDSDGNAYAHADTHSHADADGYIHTQADSHGYPAAANAYGHPTADGYSNGYPVSDRHGHGYPQGNRHAAADRHPTAHQTPDYDAHRRRGRGEHRGQHSFAD